MTSHSDNSSSPRRGGPGPRTDRARRERQAIAYLDALDRQDFDALQQLWNQAATDAELERLLLELGDGILEESGYSPAGQASAEFKEDAARVVALLEKHLSYGAPQEQAAAPTVADVAARIAADPALLSRLDSADRNTNASLLTNPTQLPAGLGMPQLTKLTESLAIAATPVYLRLFRQQAILVAMRQAHKIQGSNLAAARPAARRRGSGGKKRRAATPEGPPRPADHSDARVPEESP